VIICYDEHWFSGLNRMVVTFAQVQFQDWFVETHCEELDANQQQLLLA